MSKLKEGSFLYQITHYSLRQIVVMVIGNIILALGASLFAKTALGTHPLYTMIYAAERALSPYSSFLTYANLMIINNIILFLFQVIFRRDQIGLGTLFNMFIYPYLNTWGLMLLNACKLPLTLPAKIVYLVLAAVLMSLGISVYQTANSGVAPYDAMPFVLMKLTRLPFFGCRMLVDGTCFAVTLILLFCQKIPIFNAGTATIGVGAVVCVFCMGPIIQFFDKTVSKKLI